MTKETAKNRVMSCLGLGNSSNWRNTSYRFCIVRIGKDVTMTSNYSNFQYHEELENVTPLVGKWINGTKQKHRLIEELVYLMLKYHKKVSIIKPKVPEGTDKLPKFDYDKNGLVCLYRAIGSEEYYSLKDSGKFDVVEGVSANVKYFGVSRKETEAFADLAYNIHAVSVVMALVKKKELKKFADFTPLDEFLFKAGTVTIHEGDLNKLNEIVVRIYFI